MFKPVPDTMYDYLRHQGCRLTVNDLELSRDEGVAGMLMLLPAIAAHAQIQMLDILGLDAKIEWATADQSTHPFGVTVQIPSKLEPEYLFLTLAFMADATRRILGVKPQQDIAKQGLIELRGSPGPIQSMTSGTPAELAPPEGMPLVAEVQNIEITHQMVSDASKWVALLCEEYAPMPESIETDNERGAA